jgi:hypothetical protein
LAPAVPVNAPLRSAGPVTVLVSPPTSTCSPTLKFATEATLMFVAPAAAAADSVVQLNFGPIAPTVNVSSVVPVPMLIWSPARRLSVRATAIVVSPGATGLHSVVFWVGGAESVAAVRAPVRDAPAATNSRP